MACPYSKRAQSAERPSAFCQWRPIPVIQSGWGSWSEKFPLINKFISDPHSPMDKLTSTHRFIVIWIWYVAKRIRTCARAMRPILASSEDSGDPNLNRRQPGMERAKSFPKSWETKKRFADRNKWQASSKNSERCFIIFIVWVRIKI